MVLEKDKESPAKKVTTRSAGKIHDTNAEESKPALKGFFDSKEVTFENSGDDKVTIEYKPKNSKIEITSGQTKSLPKETTSITFNGQTISLVDPDNKNIKHIFFYDNLVLNYSVCSPKSDEKSTHLIGIRDYRAFTLDFGQLCDNLSSFTLDENALSKAKLCAFYSKKAYDLQLYEDGHTEEDLCYAHHDIKEQISFTRWAVWYNEASKRIILAFRGSSEVYDFLVDAGIYPKRLSNNFGISSGVLTMIENEWDGIVEQISKIVTANGGGKDLSLLLTGHSLGGGLAQTLLMWILLKMKDEHNNVFVDIPRENIQSWTFAGQNVFYKFTPSGSDWHSGLDAEMVEVFERFESAAHNFANLYDPVPFSPRIVASESFGPTMEYKARMGVENILSKHTGGSLVQKVVDPLIKKMTPSLVKLSEMSSFCQYYRVLAQTVVLFVGKKGQHLYLGVSAANYQEMLSRCLNPPGKKTSVHPWLGHMSVNDHSLSEGEGDEQVGYLPVLSKF